MKYKIHVKIYSMYIYLYTAHRTELKELFYTYNIKRNFLNIQRKFIYFFVHKMTYVLPCLVFFPFLHSARNFCIFSLFYSSVLHNRAFPNLYCLTYVVLNKEDDMGSAFSTQTSYNEYIVHCYRLA